MIIRLDLNTYFRIAQVGSSIHKNLLKPNDIDISINFKLPFATSKWVKCLRLGKLNLILMHGYTLQQYTSEFDMNILRGHKSLFTRKLHLHTEAKQALRSKTIIQLKRDNSLFVAYSSSKESILSRAGKYRAKLPIGWSFLPLPQALQFTVVSHSNETRV